jgi:acyl carrier protein
MTTTGTLTNFIADSIVYDRPAAQIDPDEQLLDGLLDSTDVLRLVVFIEEQFKLRVEDDELVPENFETIRTLARYVDRKTASQLDD